MIQKSANVEINSNAKQVAEEVKSIKTQLKDATNELIKAQEAFGDYSNEAINAAKKVAQLKDKIAEAKETADLFDPGNKMAAFGGAMQAVGAGFETAMGAMGMLGGESEELEKTLLKVNSAIAMADGVSRLVDSGKDFNRFKTIAVGAFNGVKASISATGIGLFLVAAGLIVANFDAIKRKVVEVFPAMANMGSLFDKIKQIAFGAGEAIKNYVLMPFKALGKVFQGDFKGALAEVKNGYNVVGNFQKGAQKEQQSQAKEHQKKMLEDSISAREKQLEVDKAKGKDTYANELKILKDKQKLNSDNKVELEKLRQEERILIASHQKKVADAQKAANDKANAERKAANDKRIADAKQAAEKERAEQEANDKAYLDKQKSLTKDIEDLKADSEQKKLDLQKQRDLEEINNLKGKTQAEKDILIASHNEKYGILQTNLDKQNALKSQKIDEDIANIQRGTIVEKSLSDAKNLQDIADFYQRKQEDLDRKQAKELENYTAQGASFAQLEALRKAHEAQDLNLQKDKEKSEKDLRKANQEANMKHYQSLGNSMQAFQELAGESTVAGKALGIAQATINTFIGISEVWKSPSMGNPVLDMAVKIASTAAVAASGFANVKKIMAVKVPGKSGGGGAGGSAPSAPVTPSVSFQNTPQGQISNSIEKATQERNSTPIKTYVVGKEVTDQQEMDRNAQNGAKY